MNNFSNTIQNINLKKIIINIINQIRNIASLIFETIKNEIINFFNGTTLKKLFDAGYEFIVGSSMDKSTRELNDHIDSLVKHVEKLKKSIESSKLFIHALISKIRENGRLRIINKLNHNPKHPEYESSFPDLNVSIPKEENFKTLDLNDLDENFNIRFKTANLQVNKKLHDIMNKGIEKSYYNSFINNQNTGTVFNQNPSPERTENTISSVQPMYDKLEIPEHLNKYFMIDFNFAVFFVDGYLIYSSTKENMIKNFKRLITNDIEQKLISQYANPVLLRKSYAQLIEKYPQLNSYHIVRAKNFYEITHLEDGNIQIFATNSSEFCFVNENNVSERHSFEVKANVILSFTEAPIIKHSYVVH